MFVVQTSKFEVTCKYKNICIFFLEKNLFCFFIFHVKLSLHE